MTSTEHLQEVVEELIDILHEQVRETEKMLVKIERVTGPLGAEGRFSVLASELAELRRRLKQIAV